MSWIKNHFRHLVLPGVHTIARRGGDGCALLDEDIGPSNREVRPSQKCKYPEAGMLYAVASSVLPKGNTTREVALGLCRQLGQANDAEFVYELDLGGRGMGDRVRQLGEGYDGVEGADVLHSFIMNSVKELKKRTQKRAQAIYPGRDVWCWEVMSRRLGMPSHYDPKVSRSIATNEKAIKKVVEAWNIKDWDRTILFDTGHAGTVPRAIGKAAGLDKMLVLMLSAEKNEEQIFKTHAKSRKKALACEYLAKYWKRATVQDDAPYQELADLEEFIKAALLTIWLWYHVSPARLPSWKDEPAVPAFKPSKGGLTIQPMSGGNSAFVGTASNLSTLWVSPASAATTSTGVDIWGSASTTGGNGWGVTTTPILNSNTFQLVDPSTGALWIDPLDMANHQYQRQKLSSAFGYATRPIDKSLVKATVDKNGMIHKLPSQPTQPSGGPSSGSAPTPTTGKLRVVPILGLPVTYGNGKPITG